MDNNNTHEVNANDNKKKSIITIIVILLILVTLIWFAVHSLNKETKEVQTQSNVANLDEKTDEKIDEKAEDNEESNSKEDDSKSENSHKILQTSAEFDKKVKNSKGRVMVDYFATWCPPCKITGPFIENMQNDGLNVYKVDVDNKKEFINVLRDQGIRALPTFVVYEDGKEVTRVMGALSESQLREMLETGKRPSAY